MATEHIAVSMVLEGVERVFGPECSGAARYQRGCNLRGSGSCGDLTLGTERGTRWMCLGVVLRSARAPKGANMLPGGL